MAKKGIDYRPWIFFTIIGAILITVLVIIGRRESYVADDKIYDNGVAEYFGYRQGSKYATSACIDKFSRYYNSNPQLSNLL